MSNYNELIGQYVTVHFYSVDNYPTYLHAKNDGALYSRKILVLSHKSFQEVKLMITEVARCLAGDSSILNIVIEHDDNFYLIDDIIRALTSVKLVSTPKPKHPLRSLIPFLSLA